jgi:hypothetical protein
MYLNPKPDTKTQE